MSELQYPIGRFTYDAETTPEKRSGWICQIAEAPAAVRAVVAGLDDACLDTPYRPGGWTVRQVVHHLADSHANAYVRFRLGLTEDDPLIKPYDQDQWALLEDARRAPLAPSLDLLRCLHDRWVFLMQSIAPEAFGRTLRHPESGPLTLDKMVQIYAWHGRHHVRQIEGLRRLHGW